MGRFESITEIEPNLSGDGLRIGIVVGRFNRGIGEGLLSACTAALAKLGVRDPDVLIVTVPGALESVGLKAEAMAREPDAFARNFVPTTAEVLYSTKLINTGENARLRFTVPTRTGSYPYVCTFPGHWRTMNGLMSVIRTGTTLPGR